MHIPFFYWIPLFNLFIDKLDSLFFSPLLFIFHSLFQVADKTGSSPTAVLIYFTMLRQEHVITSMSGQGASQSKAKCNAFKKFGFLHLFISNVLSQGR